MVLAQTLLVIFAMSLSWRDCPQGFEIVDPNGQDIGSIYDPNYVEPTPQEGEE